MSASESSKTHELCLLDKSQEPYDGKTQIYQTPNADLEGGCYFCIQWITVFTLTNGSQLALNSFKLP